jgi:hypothetical protein
MIILIHSSKSSPDRIKKRMHHEIESMLVRVIRRVISHNRVPLLLVPHFRRLAVHPDRQINVRKVIVL